MELKAWPLDSKYMTVREIKNAVKKYHADLKLFPEIEKMNIFQFFDYVKNIPYIRDVPDTEVVSRPKYLLTIFTALDCKKKSILFACFMLEKYGPGSFRFVLSSNRPDGNISHIFTQVFLNKKWLNADVTYPRNNFGEKKRVTNFEIVGG